MLKSTKSKSKLTLFVFLLVAIPSTAFAGGKSSRREAFNPLPKKTITSPKKVGEAIQKPFHKAAEKVRNYVEKKLSNPVMGLSSSAVVEAVENNQDIKLLIEIEGDKICRKNSVLSGGALHVGYEEVFGDVEARDPFAKNVKKHYPQRTGFRYAVRMSNGLLRDVSKEKFDELEANGDQTIEKFKEAKPHYLITALSCSKDPTPIKREKPNAPAKKDKPASEKSPAQSVQELNRQIAEVEKTLEGLKKQLESLKKSSDRQDSNKKDESERPNLRRWNSTGNISVRGS